MHRPFKNVGVFKCFGYSYTGERKSGADNRPHLVRGGGFCKAKFGGVVRVRKANISHRRYITYEVYIANSVRKLSLLVFSPSAFLYRARLTLPRTFSLRMTRQKFTFLVRGCHQKLYLSVTQSAVQAQICQRQSGRLWSF